MTGQDKRNTGAGAAAAILIAGPTASGKSAIALALAERLGAMVVNADSMQVYRELRVITARPSAEEEARAPHRLYGHVAGGEGYSVGRWLADMAGILEEARQSARLPIIVGGTGLYFRALLEGLSPIPDIPEPVRRRWRTIARARDTAALHAMLVARDPVMGARIRPSDRQRVLRALEVVEATGRSLADWQAEGAGPPLIAEDEACRIVIAPDRAALHARINARFSHMLEAGALEEVARLAALDLDPALPIMRAHGVPPLMAHLAGRISLDEAASRSRAETRQYAKRQFTWLRRNMIAWRWFSAQESKRLTRDIFAFVNDRLLTHP